MRSFRNLDVLDKMCEMRMVKNPSLCLIQLCEMEKTNCCSKRAESTKTEGNNCEISYFVKSNYFLTQEFFNALKTFFCFLKIFSARSNKKKKA